MTSEQHYLGNASGPSFVTVPREKAVPVLTQEQWGRFVRLPQEDELTPFFHQCQEAEQHTLAALRHLQDGEPELAEPELRLAQARVTTAKKIAERQKDEVKAIQSAMDRMSFEGQTVKSAADFHRAGFRVIEVDS